MQRHNVMSTEYPAGSILLLIVQCVVLLKWFLLDFSAIFKHRSFAGHFAILIAITIELDVLWLWRRGYISALLVLTLLIKNYATWQCVVHKTSSIYSIVQHVVLLNRHLGICKDRQGILKSETILLKALHICCFSFGSSHSTPRIKTKIGSKL